jgi:hypothetical protein
VRFLLEIRDVHSFDNRRIAARIRGLLSGQGDTESVAQRLRVHEIALRMSMDETSPYPTLDVIAAVVREYGVDPHWLVTGDYDSGSHRAAIQANTSELPAVVNDMIHRVAQVSPPNLSLHRG